MKTQKLEVAVATPFSLTQALTFIGRFCPVANDYAMTADSLTAAAYGSWFTLRARRDDELTIELPVDAPERLARVAANFVGAHEDPKPFYAAAEADAPMRPIVRELRGLHHVRFLTLEEIAVYCVMMQRNPITRAASMKAKFVAAFGESIETPAGVLKAMPAFRELVKLDGEAIGRAISHGPKGKVIANVVKGVAQLGEEFLTTAPYAEARDALLEIDGIGPFSAAAILLRGLGRMDEVPTINIVEEEGRVLYGKAFDFDAIQRRYGRHIGWWSYYLKSGVARALNRRPVRRSSPRAVAT